LTRIQGQAPLAGSKPERLVEGTGDRSPLVEGVLRGHESPLSGSQGRPWAASKAWPWQVPDRVRAPTVGTLPRARIQGSEIPWLLQGSPGPVPRQGPWSSVSRGAKALRRGAQGENAESEAEIAVPPAGYLGESSPRRLPGPPLGSSKTGLGRGSKGDRKPLGGRGSKGGPKPPSGSKAGLGNRVF
jgi:hypothetical protein